MVIADSNIWINYLRAPEGEIGLQLQSLVGHDMLLMVGVVLAEVLQGARGEPEYERLVPSMNLIPYAEVSKRAWTRAASLAIQLRSRGQTVPLTDLVIAAQALEEAHEVFTLDEHFHRIPGLRLYAPDKV